jgi:hypothetical protein
MNIIKDTKSDSEFRGLFLGEGYSSVVKYKYKRKYGEKSYDYQENYRPQLSLAQRGDNKEVLNWIKQRYGGNVWMQRGVGNHNTSYHWTITNIKEISKICEILLDGVIPSKKRKSIEIVKEYCDWKLKRGLQVKMSEEDKSMVREWYNSCRKNHEYSVV